MGIGRLGDIFPEEEKIKTFLAQLKPGCIFYLSCDFTTPPKDKYLVLACVEPRPLFFIINSEIHEYIKKRPYLLRCQIKIDAKRHGFLNHDSYISCADAIDAFHVKDIEQQVLKSMDRIKGMVSADTRKHILSAVRSAETISKAHKEWIIRALE